MTYKKGNCAEFGPVNVFQFKSDSVKPISCIRIKVVLIIIIIIIEDIRFVNTYFRCVPVQISEHNIAVLAGTVSGCLGAETKDRREIIPQKNRYVIQAVLTRRSKYFMFFTMGAKSFEGHVFF